MTIIEARGPLYSRIIYIDACEYIWWDTGLESSNEDCLFDSIQYQLTCRSIYLMLHFLLFNFFGVHIFSSFHWWYKFVDERSVLICVESRRPWEQLDKHSGRLQTMEVLHRQIILPRHSWKYALHSTLYNGVFSRFFLTLHFLYPTNYTCLWRWFVFLFLVVPICSKNSLQCSRKLVISRLALLDFMSCIASHNYIHRYETDALFPS